MNVAPIIILTLGSSFVLISILLISFKYVKKVYFKFFKFKKFYFNVCDFFIQKSNESEMDENQSLLDSSINSRKNDLRVRKMAGHFSLIHKWYQW